MTSDGKNPSRQSGSSSKSDIDKAADRLNQETKAAREAAAEGRADLKDAAGAVAEQAQEEAQRQAESAKDQAAGSLHAFADAIRSASDELATKQPGVMSDIIGEAAKGLEDLSRSLEGRSAGQIVNDVRDFGHKSPGTFLAGSILAGIAIGRFAGASAGHRHGNGKHAPVRAPSSSTGKGGST